MRRKRVVFVGAITLAALSLLMLGLGRETGPGFQFLEGRKPFEVHQLSGTRTPVTRMAYAFEADYSAVATRARAELLPQGWKQTDSNRLFSAFRQGDTSLTIYRARVRPWEELQHRKRAAGDFSPTYHGGAWRGHISVVIQHRHRSPIQRLTDFVNRAFNGGP